MMKRSCLPIVLLKSTVSKFFLNKNNFHFLFILSLALIFSNSAAAKVLVDPNLQGFIKNAQAEQTVRVVVLMHYAPVTTSPPLYARSAVVSYYRWQVATMMDEVVKALKKAKAQKEVKLATVYSINQSFSADITQQGLKVLSAIPEIKKIYLNQRTSSERVYNSIAESTPQNRPMYNFIDTGLLQLIKESPLIDGRGVLIGSVDLGLDGTHQFFQGKIAGFYDSHNKKTGLAFDYADHGTHTAGIMVAGSRENFIGVAPGAKIVVAAGYDFEDQIRSLQFMLNPDGDEKTTNDIPRAVNNSWNSQNAPDQEIYYRAISALEAVGTISVFSAGNDGPSPRSITPPKEHPAAFVVGGYGPGGKVFKETSVGPAIYKGQTMQKPDLIAPAVDIYSTVPGDRFAQKTGTSMAAPHVTATIALMLQVNPELNPQEIRAMLVNSAQTFNPKAKQAWDPVVGWGRLNIYGAVRLAEAARRQRSNEVSGVPAGTVNSSLTGNASFKEPHPWIGSRVDQYILQTSDVTSNGWL